LIGTWEEGIQKRRLLGESGTPLVAAEADAVELGGIKPVATRERVGIMSPWHM